MLLVFLLAPVGVLYAVAGFTGDEDTVPVNSHPDEPLLNSLRKREAALLQQSGAADQAEEGTANVHFFLGGSSELIPSIPVKNPVTLTQDYWNQANEILLNAGRSTSLPPRNVLRPNAPPTPLPPTPWERVMSDGAQPMATQLGGAVMYGLSGKPTGTPPPSQKQTNAQFVAQCPMVIFQDNLTIQRTTCQKSNSSGQYSYPDDDGRVQPGAWLEPNPPYGVRPVLRWRVIDDMGTLFFGVDSALSGKGTVQFARIKQKVTMTGFKFSLTNCLGTERWVIEEEVIKIDLMGKVASTIERSDTLENRPGYFIKYNIFGPNGALVAHSNLFRTGTDAVTYYAYAKDNPTFGAIIANATRRYKWKGAEWMACAPSPKSAARGWDISFQVDKSGMETVATVQDIRVAIAGAITLMAYRDESRGKDGLNTTGQSREWFLLLAGVTLICLIGVLLCNFALVFVNAGIKEKLRKTFWDTERAILPKRPLSHHAPPMHATW